MVRKLRKMIRNYHQFPTWLLIPSCWKLNLLPITAIPKPSDPTMIVKTSRPDALSNAISRRLPAALLVALFSKRPLDVTNVFVPTASEVAVRCLR
eukprot:s90_g25.t1